jgi:hypothetical protein
VSHDDESVPQVQRSIEFLLPSRWDHRWRDFVTNPTSGQWDLPSASGLPDQFPAAFLRYGMVDKGIPEALPEEGVGAFALPLARTSISPTFARRRAIIDRQANRGIGGPPVSPDARHTRVSPSCLDLCKNCALCYCHCPSPGVLF